MKLIDAERPDAALLDINIIGSTSAEVAERLVRNGVPFVLATGYGAQNDITGSCAIIDKPYNRKQVQAAFELFGRPHGAGDHGDLASAQHSGPPSE